MSLETTITSQTAIPACDRDIKTDIPYNRSLKIPAGASVYCFDKGKKTCQYARPQVNGTTVCVYEPVKSFGRL